jgi:glycyl-tRNA synthetase beta chain
MAEKLKGVVYHPRLGTSWEKVERFRALAVWLSEELFPGDKTLAGRVDEAARLCKADLTSGMVYEFPELQGLMGQNYAERAGIDHETAQAISGHYLPIGEGEEMPEGDAGAIVGLADRMDTLAGMIGLGYVPSGSEDPYALRRAANAIMRILIGRGYRVSLESFAKKALSPLSDKFKDSADEAAGRLSGFLRNRAGAYLARSGARGDLVEAVLSASGDTGWHDPADAAARLSALEKLAGQAETFEPLTTTFKRVSNIIRQSGQSAGGGDFSQKLLEDDSERALAEAVEGCEGDLGGLLAQVRDSKGALDETYVKIMDRVTALRPAVDTFFDDLLVMAEDEKLRKNRLALLARVGALFAPVADFGKIQAAARGRGRAD